ncbi:uncharacterized protein LOC129589537 [Paramacrobiotus metropolitanus]|uniref:uncharacterized protein LOC129589537 n=1 Tax=Paramacrobiotus metropolitanus TaxID=2943436 RepID=UPI002445BF6D|nr:uncharacterized protein LOC129589537 [Paramacrobiotus metropolitanus]XP_055340307.1 uncharacterized protein LOC129589537 [Paramacrobiotus metropolitanus]
MVNYFYFISMGNMENSDVVVECGREDEARDCGTTVADAENQVTLDFSNAGRRNENVPFGHVHHTAAAVSSSGPDTFLDPCSVDSGQPALFRSSSSSVDQLTPTSLDVRDYEAMAAYLEKRLLDREQLLHGTGQDMEALRAEYRQTLTEKNETLQKMARAQSGLLSQFGHLQTQYEGYQEYAESTLAFMRMKYQELEAEKCASEMSLHSRIAALEAELSSLQGTHCELKTQSEQLTKSTQDEAAFVLRRKLKETESLLMTALQCDTSDDEPSVVEESGDILQDGINVRKVVVRLVRALKEIKALRKINGARKDEISEFNREIAEFREELESSTIERDKVFCTDVVNGSALQRENFAVVKGLGGDEVLQCGEESDGSTPKGVKRRREDLFATTDKRQKSEPGTISPSTSSVPEALPPFLHDVDAVRFLPVEIMTEVFQYLHVVDRCRVRAVCAGWNAIQQSAAASSLQQIQFHCKGDFSRALSASIGCARAVDVPAQRCWSRRTVAVVGQNAKRSAQRWPLCGARFLREIMQGGAEEKKLENLALKDISCRFLAGHSFPAPDYIAALHKGFDTLAAVCRTLTVKNFTCTIDSSWKDGLVPITIHIPFGRMRHDRRLSVADWWGMIEQRCPLLDDHQTNLVSNALKEYKQNPGLADQLELIRRGRQHNDPRKGCTYLNSFDSPNAPLASVDVNRLTRMTQYLMYCEITNVAVNAELSWPTYS